MNDREIKIETQGDLSPGFVGRDYQVTQTVINQYNNSKKKRWKKLSEIIRPITIDDENQRRSYLSHLTLQLHRVFKNSGYISFVSLFSLCIATSKDITLPGYCLVSHQTKYTGALRENWKYLWNSSISREAKQEYRELLLKEWNDLKTNWSLDVNISFTHDLSALEFIYNPDEHKIRIGTPSILSTDPTDYPDKVRTTSEFLTFIALMSNSSVAFCSDLGCISSYYPLSKFYLDVMDNGAYSLNNIRVNVEDCEEYDYVNTVIDVEVQKYL